MIEHISVSELKPFPTNPRRHPQTQVELIAKSLREFGWTTPLLVDDQNNVIAGHGRLQAVSLLQGRGLRGPDGNPLPPGTVPVIRLRHLTEQQAAAYRLVDNRLTEIGDWDEELLAEIMRGFEEAERDLLLGWTEDEISVILDGWDHEFGEENEKIKENLDGIEKVFKVYCPQEQAEEVFDLLGSALGGIDGVRIS